MNVRSSSKVLVSTKSNTSGTQIELRRLPQYAVCAGLGMLGGAVGVGVIFNASEEAQSNYRYYSKYHQSDK